VQYLYIPLDLRGAQVLGIRELTTIEFSCDKDKSRLNNCILRMDRSQLRYARGLEYAVDNEQSYYDSTVYIDDRLVKRDELVAMIKEEKEKHNMNKYYYS
jgi:hypothetical protein